MVRLLNHPSRHRRTCDFFVNSETRQTSGSPISGAVVEEILVVFSHTHGAGLMRLDRERLTFRYAGRDVRLAYIHGVGVG